MNGFAFPPDTLDFLAELRANNDKTWFDANRGRYQAAYVEAGKAFVEAAAPVLAKIVPGIRAEPRVLGSIFRINRDTRFSADKRPYKDHLDFWFWQGDRKSAVSGLFARITPDLVGVGAGAHHFDKPALTAYRAALADPDAAAELARAAEHAERAGYPIGGQNLARTPNVPLADPAAERFLRHTALVVALEEPRELALDERLLPALEGHWLAMAPIHRWLVEHVQRGVTQPA
jgi:uncharacterized protein (TIGR02453 family)